MAHNQDTNTGTGMYGIYFSVPVKSNELFSHFMCQFTCFELEVVCLAHLCTEPGI